jgi:hypothetical protein
MMVAASNLAPVTLISCEAISLVVNGMFRVSKLVIVGGWAITLHPVAVYASMYPIVEL